MPTVAPGAAAKLLTAPDLFKEQCYVNGTWTTLASSPHTRLYYPAEVLKDGRVFVAGGEYGTGGPFAEVYNPQTNSWSNATPGALAHQRSVPLGQ